MDAKKCDRCGEFFETKKSFKFEVRKNVWLRGPKFIDICNDCNLKIDEFMAKKEE